MRQYFLILVFGLLSLSVTFASSSCSESVLVFNVHSNKNSALTKVNEVVGSNIRKSFVNNVLYEDRKIINSFLEEKYLVFSTAHKSDLRRKSILI